MAEESGRRYAIVTPVRNEERYLERTIRSVEAQSEPPAAWIIVDDGSTDATRDIIRRHAETTRFIRPHVLEDDGSKQSQDRLIWAAEAIAFNKGLALLDLDEFDFIVKLDGDLEFGPDYFASVMDEFERVPSLGIAGGYCYQVRDGKRVLEWNPRTHVRGPTKVYRVECFRQIGGIKPVYAWDGLDVLEAQQAGWDTRSLDLVVLHLKPTGSVGGLMHASVRMGRGGYLLGYHPLFVLARSARLALARPYVLGGIGYLTGFMRAAVERPDRVAEPRTIAYLRSKQMERLRAAGDLRELRSLLGRGGR